MYFIVPRDWPFMVLRGVRVKIPFKEAGRGTTCKTVKVTHSFLNPILFMMGQFPRSRDTFYFQEIFVTFIDIVN